MPPQEIETKLDLHPAVELPPLDAVIEGSTVTSEPAVTLKATYFDTDDLRLIRSGITVRHRPEEGTDPWQVKLPDDPLGEAISRAEIAFPGGSRRPPAAVRSLVTAATRGAELRPVARLVTRRQRVTISRDEAPIAEVADDEVTVFQGPRLLARFREVEVEAARRKVRRALVRALVDAGAEETGNQPKLVRALGPAATAPPDVAAGTQIGPDPGVAVVEVVRHALLSDLTRMIAHDPGTRLGEDPEELHQMRVATRRLRTTLRTYRPVLDSAWASGLREELRGLTAALGDVRDLDVLSARVARDVQRLPPEDRDAGERVRALLRDRRAAARATLMRVLDDRDYPNLLDRMVAAAQAPACPAPDAPAGPALAPIVARAWTQVAKAQARGDPLHDLRLRIKRLRYAADAVAPAFGAPATDLAAAAARSQDVLGVHQDAVIAVEAYRSLLPQVDTEMAHALGQLTAAALRRQRRAARRWAQEWPRLRRPSLRRFLDDTGA